MTYLFRNTQTLKEYDILVVDRMCVSDIGIDVLNEACRDSQKVCHFNIFIVSRKSGLCVIFFRVFFVVIL
jgi:hypothetical protein